MITSNVNHCRRLFTLPGVAQNVSQMKAGDCRCCRAFYLKEAVATPKIKIGLSMFEFLMDEVIDMKDLCLFTVYQRKGK